MDSKYMGVYPKKDGETVYYTMYRGHRFTLPRLDAKNKPIQQTNPQTGAPLFDGLGKPVFFEDSFSFIPWRDRFTEIGYCSVFIVDGNTPKHVAAELKKDSEDRKSMILSEKAFLEMTNPDLAARLPELESKDVEIAELKAKLAKGGSTVDKEVIKSLQDENAELKKKLSS